MPFRYGEFDRGLARLAYRSWEPYHLVAYFAPEVAAAAREAGVSWRAAYTGMRAAPFGPVPGEVVAGAFYSWRPEAVAAAWAQALAAASPEEWNGIRTGVLDASMRRILGSVVSSPELAAVASRARAAVAGVPARGRPLGAAWAALDWPEEPHLVLWQATAVWREWRGDGHIATLVVAGLDELESMVLHLAPGPDGSAPGNPLGRDQLLSTRKWTEDDWAAASSRLVSRGLLGSAGSLTEDGVQLRDWTEAATDDASASVWADRPDADEVIRAVRPYAKLVIDSGVIPGTTKKR